MLLYREQALINTLSLQENADENYSFYSMSDRFLLCLNIFYLLLAV